MEQVIGKESQHMLEQSKLLLLDIDGTLIDETYTTTADVRPHVKAIQEQGWLVGLSSDSPYEAMQEWKALFGMNGPIVAEKGAAFDSGQGLIFDPSVQQDFENIKLQALEAVTGLNVHVWHGNPVNAILGRHKIAAEPGGVVLVNKFRRCSFAVSVRYINEQGTMHLDTSLAKEVIQAIQEGCDTTIYDEDINYESGVYIVGQKDTTKRKGSIALLGALQQPAFGMIGNSYADYVGDDIAVHFAVGNATREYKQVSAYTAHSTLTKGVIEILKLATN